MTKCLECWKSHETWVTCPPFMWIGWPTRDAQIGINQGFRLTLPWGGSDVR